MGIPCNQTKKPWIQLGLPRNKRIVEMKRSRTSESGSDIGKEGGDGPGRRYLCS